MSLKLPGPESERKENTIKNEKLSQSEKTDFLVSEMASSFHRPKSGSLFFTNNKVIIISL